MEVGRKNIETASRRRLLDNIHSLYLLQGLNYVIPMAVLPYLVRVLGMETYGLMAFAQSFAQYFNILTDYGFNFSATRALAQNRGDAGLASKTFCCVFLIKMMLTGLGAVALFILLWTVPRLQHDSAFFLIAFLAVLGNTLFPGWYFQGMEQMRYISILTGTARLLSAALLFVFVHGPRDGLLALVIQSMGMVFAGLLGLGISLRKFKVHLQLPSMADLKHTFVDGWHLFVSNAAVSLYTNTNLFLVGMLAGNVQAGYFSAAEKIIRAMIGVVMPITQAVFPHVSSLVIRSHKIALEFIVQTLKWMTWMTLPASLLIFIFARPLAVLCFGHAAAGSVPVLRSIAFLPFLIAVSNVLGIQTMVTFGLDKQFSRILLFAGALNVTIGIPLIKLFAAQGAGIAVLITETAVTLTMTLVLRRNGITFGRAERTPV
jgi:PST family polysaccharide transporter